MFLAANWRAWSEALVGIELPFFHFLLFESRVRSASQEEEGDAAEVRKEDKAAKDVAAVLWVLIDVEGAKKWLGDGGRNRSADRAEEEEGADGEGFILR